MWKKLFNHNWTLALLSGFCLVLAFPPIEIVPVAFFFPVFLNALLLRCEKFWSGAFFGYLVSLAIMVGGFYWVVYVIHFIGNLPWVIAFLLYLGFCGFGALNFPLFVGLAAWLHKKIHLAQQPPWFKQLWFSLGLPALFTLIEFLSPKLFPWYIGHAFYKTLWINQIVEVTGVTFLNFCLYSLGSVLSLFILPQTLRPLKAKPSVFAIPVSLWLICLLFSLWRGYAPYTAPSSERALNVALIQANIGSLDKVAARAGSVGRVQHVVDTYRRLTNMALKNEERPELVIWPETAMPFYLTGNTYRARQLREQVSAWGVSLITGGYAPYRSKFFRDYNAAILLDSDSSQTHPQLYHKNILLAFGEYMPFGELFPNLYRMFPQVSNFKKGEKQNPVTLQNGTRIGISICYEAIVPSFYRKVAKNNVQVIVNLTNDSWFGPTSEPHQHAALSVFRAIETRIPMIRVTNTGLSFTVDARGKMGKRIGVHEENYLNDTVLIPDTPPHTLYLRYGDWFVVLCILMGLIMLVLSGHVPFSIRPKYWGSAS